MVAKKLSAPNVTKTRLLEATEALFIKYGYDAVLLRQITERAKVNLAAVNYHFGDKDSLMKALLMQRLGPLNDQRLELLAKCEEQAEGPLDCETLLGARIAADTRLMSLAMTSASVAGRPRLMACISRRSSVPAMTPEIALRANCRRTPSSLRGRSGKARAKALKKRSNTGW